MTAPPTPSHTAAHQPEPAPPAPTTPGQPSTQDQDPAQEDRRGLSISLGNQGVILQSRGDVDRALALYKEQERICRELGNPDGLAKSLINQALIHAGAGRADEASPLADQAQQLVRRFGLTALAQHVDRIAERVRSSGGHRRLFRRR